MITIIENIAVGFVASLHIGFLILEMFYWNKPQGRKIFGLKKEFAEQSATLAANQGLYNGFLAAGLIFSFFIDTSTSDFRLFILSCIILAGLFGAATVSRSILWVQACPAAVAMALVILS